MRSPCAFTRRLVIAQAATSVAWFAMPIWGSGKSKWLRTSLVQFAKFETWWCIKRQRAFCCNACVRMGRGRPQPKDQVLVIDCATKLRVAVPLMEPYGINQMRTESFSQVIEAVSKSWLAHYPKPDVIIPVNAWASSQRSSPTSAATRTLSCPCLLKSISGLGLMVWLKMPCGSSNIPQLRFRCTTLHKIHL